MDDIEFIKSQIKTYPGFPKPGILFRDIFSILQDPTTFKKLHLILLKHLESIKYKIDCIVGIESRGFLIGPPLALELNVPFVPIRKKGKLPGILKSVTYSLEYGEDTVEVQSEALKPKMRVLIVDDLLATGGTLVAACKLIESCQAEVVESLVIVELVELNGRQNVTSKLHSILQF